jgi:hypothetical protein
MDDFFDDVALYDDDAIIADEMFPPNPELAKEKIESDMGTAVPEIIEETINAQKQESKLPEVKPEVCDKCEDCPKTGSFTWDEPHPITLEEQAILPLAEILRRQWALAKLGMKVWEEAAEAENERVRNLIKSDIRETINIVPKEEPIDYDEDIPSSNLPTFTDQIEIHYTDGTCDISIPDNIVSRCKASPNDRSAPKPKPFTPPSIDDIQSWIDIKKYKNVQAESFYNHFKKEKWKIEGKQIENWRAIVADWNDKPTILTEGNPNG